MAKNTTKTSADMVKEAQGTVKVEDIIAENGPITIEAKQATLKKLAAELGVEIGDLAPNFNAKEAEEEKSEKKLFNTEALSESTKSFGNSIKNTLHGFLTIVALLLIVACFAIYKLNIVGTVTINIPAFGISYFKVAIVATILTILGWISTSSK